MNVQLRGGDPLKYRGDILVLGHFSDVKPLKGTVASLDWRFNASISCLWKTKPDLLDFGRQTLLPTLGKLPFPYVLLMGLGPIDQFSRDLRQEIYRLGLIAALSVEARKVSSEGLPVSTIIDMSVIDDFSMVVGRLGDTTLQKAALYIRSPELLAAARTAHMDGEKESTSVSSR